MEEGLNIMKLSPHRNKLARFLISGVVIFVVLVVLGGAGTSRAATAYLSPYHRYPCVGANSGATAHFGDYSPYDIYYDSDGGSPVGWYSPSWSSSSRSATAAYPQGHYDPYIDVNDDHDNYANGTGEVDSDFWSGCPN